MSTYYGFHCDACKQSGGHLSRQAWGAGNFDIVDTFKFVMLHALQCGAPNVVMHSEHDENDWVDVSMPGPDRVAFLAAAENIFPRSDDWDLVARHKDFGDAKAEWQAIEQKRAEGVAGDV